MVEFKMHVVLLSLLNKLLLKMPLGTFWENTGALFGGKSLKSNDIIFKLLWGISADHALAENRDHFTVLNCDALPR